MRAPYRRCPTTGALIFDAPADARLDALERRVAALEAALRAPYTGAPEPSQPRQESAT